LQLPVRFLALVLLSAHALTTYGEDYKNWYQVEIIVFALNKPTPGDEVWPLAPLSYPSDMVRISPEDDNTLSPHTLRQLNQILAHEALLPDEDASSDEISPATSFLFESRSRFKVPSPQNNRQLPENAEQTRSVEGEDDSPPPDAADPAMASDNQATLERQTVNYDDFFDTDEPQAFRAIGAKHRTLNAFARSINRSSLYRMILHQAWRQPIDKEATPVLIQAGKHYDDSYEVDGSIGISRSRFLHLTTDLWYTNFTSRYQQASLPITLDLPPEVASKYPEVTTWESERGNYLPIHSHKLDQSRRMRSATVHFIDHPYFGILVRIDQFDWNAFADQARN